MTRREIYLAAIMAVADCGKLFGAQRKEIHDELLKQLDLAKLCEADKGKREKEAEA